MNVVLWILQILLGFGMLMAGAMKAMQGRDKLIENPQMGWVEDYTDQQVRGIGAAEVLAAAGLTLPWLLDIAPILTPLAAVGVIIVMAGAVMRHRARNEPFIIPVVLGVIAIVIAVGRLGDL